jgi:hypothetical protein
MPGAKYKDTDGLWKSLLYGWDRLTGKPTTFPPTTHDHLETIYETTQAATEGWYRIATFPITSQYKQLAFRLKAFTAVGTTTQMTVWVDNAYYSGNYGSQSAGIMANVSHSYNSWTNAENGYVILYVRVSFDATTGYVDVYKYKTVTTTIQVQALQKNDWTFLTGAQSVNPAAGAYRASQVTTQTGQNGNQVQANSASYASYVNSGLLGGVTISNTTDKTNKWVRAAYIRFDYNGSYLKGRTLNSVILVQEHTEQGQVADVANLEDYKLYVRANLAAHADGG